ncbi:MAG: serine/threonine protein kinase [Deltaproteobacteria bacterium]|jgi:serine/threonine-protein kinase|nr:serine/threonine protein kinase [Deltaproteobacteria bacterium]MBW2533909.1 serine/threonine protein kinase [Deltaproteobacteria bacterium]
MDVSPTIEPGTILADKYEVRGELGRGGMATIYEAVHVEIGKRVAIKLLAGHLTKSAPVVERFLREARAVAAIRSPYICDVFDSGKTAEGVPFLVLELLEGETLYDRMVEDRQMSPEFTLAVALQCCRGLAKAHEANIVHRDLKPENLFLAFDADGQMIVKILDFGLAKFYEEPLEELESADGSPDPSSAPDGKRKRRRKRRLTRDGAVFGTPTYMSPEQVRGQGSADPRADLWALACITYECLTGTTVWSTEEGVAMTFVRIASSPLPDPADLRPDLPPEFGAWFRRALDRELDQRHRDVHEWADSLAAALGCAAPDGALDSDLIKQLMAAAPELERPWAARWANRATRPPSIAQADPGHGTARPAPAPSRKAPARAARPRRAVPGWLLVVGAAVVAAALTVLIWQRQTARPVPSASHWIGPMLASATPVEPSTHSDRHLLEQHPWLAEVEKAQEAIAKRQNERALGLLRSAFEASRHGIARNLIEQLQVAMLAQSKAAPCQVTGIARPRRYDLAGTNKKVVAATPPFVTWGPRGAIVTWADRRDGKTRARAVLLDNALKNRGLPVDVSPETTSGSTPTLLASEEQVVAVYWDASGNAPGVYARWLTAVGAIASSPVLLTDKRPGRYVATAAPAAAGHWLVAWAGGPDRNSVDLYLRRLASSLEPAGEPVRVTDYVARRVARGQIRDIAMQARGERIHVAYAFARDPIAQVRYQILPHDTPPPGLETPDGGKSTEDRTLATERVLSPPEQRAHEPTLGCIDQGCFVAWHAGSSHGAGIAFIDGGDGEVRWHKQFAPRGGHPRIAVAKDGAVLLAWSEGGRLTVAPLDENGVGPTSRVARVVGEQPACSLTAGAHPGEWYMAWLDFEAGHLEPYVARFQCK